MNVERGTLNVEPERSNAETPFECAIRNSQFAISDNPPRPVQHRHRFRMRERSCRHRRAQSLRLPASVSSQRDPAGDDPRGGRGGGGDAPPRRVRGTHRSRPAARAFPPGSLESARRERLSGALHGMDDGRRRPGGRVPGARRGTDRAAVRSRSPRRPALGDRDGEEQGGALASRPGRRPRSHESGGPVRARAAGRAVDGPGLERGPLRGGKIRVRPRRALSLRPPPAGSFHASVRGRREAGPVLRRRLGSSGVGLYDAPVDRPPRCRGCVEAVGGRGEGAGRDAAGHRDESQQPLSL